MSANFRKYFRPQTTLRTDGAARAESSLLELCRVATDEDFVKSVVSRQDVLYYCSTKDGFPSRNTTYGVFFKHANVVRPTASV